MVTTIQKWGNSQGLRLSKRALEDVRLSVGDAVDVVVQGGSIVVKPARRARRRHSLRQLVARIPKDYKPAEVDWGRPAGREAW